MGTCLYKWISSWNMVAGLACLIWGAVQLGILNNSPLTSSNNSSSLGMGIGFVIFGIITIGVGILLFCATSSNRTLEAADSLLRLWFVLATLKLLLEIAFVVYVALAYAGLNSDIFRSLERNLDSEFRTRDSLVADLLVRTFKIVRQMLLAYIIVFPLDTVGTIIAIRMVFVYRSQMRATRRARDLEQQQQQQQGQRVGVAVLTPNAPTTFDQMPPTYSDLLYPSHLTRESTTSYDYTIKPTLK
ncbi:hypothetical protein BV898_10680 [Hypsibius exemplaris]|uniref:Uncharacterized protein n=1 Tax=Hypsibius exemplaris TaxID=2072580 RepID=A0A1W0WIX5_HYPEX|nr:hypothetical protein BV898_10680 [Hypsibius exemplaris]